jgi:hypothetical protein
MGGIAYLELTFMAELRLPPHVVQQEQAQKANSYLSHPKILISNTDSRAQLIPTNRMAAGTTILSHQHKIC